MFENDITAFSRILDSVCGAISRGAYAPSQENTAIWFRALSQFDMATVRAAFDAHVKDPQRGRFVPTPADIIAQIEGKAASDGRPGPEEAWSSAIRGADEAKTVVWTEETAQAWGIAQPIFDLGDEVGARMAFKEAYTRLVTESRRDRKPVLWSASIGHDPYQRDAEIARATAAGLLPAPKYEALPAPKPDPARLAKLVEQVVKPKLMRDSLDWARDLKAREESGGEMSEVQRSSWRAALEGKTKPGEIIGKFTPIPEDCLPPAMRKDAAAFYGVPA